MTRRTLLVAALVAGCSANPAAVREQVAGAASIPLRNADFEAPRREGERCPSGWACTMHADPDSFRFFLDGALPAQGMRSLCVERVTHEPWGLVSQTLPAQALRGRRLRFSVAMRGERLGGPGAGPWITVQGPAGLLRHEERVSVLTREWARYAIDFEVPAEAQFVDVGATLVGGGRACLDDARLEPT